MREAAYETTRIASEGTKQTDIAAAFAAQTGAALQAAVRSAERRHLARIWQAALPNGMSASQQFAELHSDPPPLENITRTDATPSLSSAGDTTSR